MPGFVFLAEMKHLLPLLLLCLLLTARAEEWRSEQYGCALILPSNEPWQRGNSSPLPAGEVIYSASNMDTKQGLMVVHIPDLPTNDVQMPAMVERLKGTLASLGFATTTAVPLERDGLIYVQFIAQRMGEGQGKIVCVARATIRQAQAYLILTFGRGDEDRVSDKDFMRVMDTFHFVDPTALSAADMPPALDPLFNKNRIAYIICFGVAGMAVCGFGVMLLATRRRYH